MSVVRPTSKFCAILFCAALWLNPVGAQQKTKEMPVQENNGTELKMDKVPFALERQSSLSQIGMEKVQAIKHDARFLNAREVLNNKLSETVELTEEQKLEGVRNYMKAALAPVAKDASSASLYLGGALFSYDLYTLYAMGKFTIGQDTVTPLTAVSSPISSAQGHTGYPYWGVWTGKHFEGFWLAIKSMQVAGNFGYFTYDLATGRATNLSAATGFGLTMMPAFDYSQNKIIALQTREHEEGEAYVYDSTTVHTALPGTGVYTEVGKISGLEADVKIVAVAMNKEGVMYAMATDSCLYTVNTTTWAVTKVGNVGIGVSENMQALAVDYRSGKLYWSYEVTDTESDEEFGFAEINTTTAQLTPMTFGEGNILGWMYNIYYTDNQPKDVVDFGLNYKEGVLTAGFTVPALTVNNESIAANGLDTVEIFKVENGQLAGRVYAKQNPVPGEAISTTIANPGTSGSTVTYAVRSKDKNGKYSAFVTASVLLFDVTLPYSNGFEDADQILTNTTILVVDPQNQGYVGRVDSAHYEGSYSFRITGSYAGRDNRQMILQGIPVEKGAGYAVSFYGKTDVEEDGILFAFDGAAFKSYYSVYNDEWSPVELTYTATATGQMSLTLQGYGVGDGTKFFIDNLKVVQTSSPAAPAAMSINNVTAAENGVLQAIVNVTLPSKTMAGEDLAKIDSIVFEYVAPVGGSVDFSVAEKTMVKDGLTPYLLKIVALL